MCCSRSWVQRSNSWMLRASNLDHCGRVSSWCIRICQTDYIEQKLWELQGLTVAKNKPQEYDWTMNQSSKSDSFHMPVSVIHKQICSFNGGYLAGEWILHKEGGLVCPQNPILSCCNCSSGFTTLASNVTSVLYKHHRCFLIPPTIASWPLSHRK